MSNIGKTMKYIKLSEVPKDRLPIYFCDAVITITEVKRNKKTVYDREVNKIVLKGLCEDDLIKAFRKKHMNSLLSKREVKYSKITAIKIKLIKSLGYGVIE